MTSFDKLLEQFLNFFEKEHFPASPENLYSASNHILKIGGKRLRPIGVLMGQELFSPITNDSYYAATAIELFHNFSLIHDDIMDKAPIRRGKETVHKIYGENTAILAGDVMLVKAYEYLNKLNINYQSKTLELFNICAREVCEGQQLDMDFEQRNNVELEEYINMITLKTSVLLATSFKMGALIGGASVQNQNLIYEFGKNLGIAFQIQDDYLDCFGAEEKVGKLKGGDILAGKKTFLWIFAKQALQNKKLKEFEEIFESSVHNKVELISNIFIETGAKAKTLELKQKYFDKAIEYLQEIAVISSRKAELEKLANFLVQRDY